MSEETSRGPQRPKVGDRLPVEEHRPTTVDLFRYSAVTWNSHRIHYDREYAREEGYPDVVVQSHLHGAYLCKVCTDWLGSGGTLVSLSNSVRRYATAGDTLRCSGQVTEVTDDPVGYRVVIDLTETRTSDDVVCAEGRAEVLIRTNPRDEAAATTKGEVQA